MIVDEMVGDLLLSKVLDWVCPQNITHEPVSGWLTETVDLYASVRGYLFDIGESHTNIPNIIERVQLWRKTTMDAKELFVHDRRQWQRTERLHTCVIYTLRVFVLALETDLSYRSFGYLKGGTHIQA